MRDVASDCASIDRLGEAENVVNVITILCDTLRRDHCGPYNHGAPIARLGDPTQPDWVVPTPNLDRLAARGTVFENAWCGSHPCMPARRDMYTGRFEFPFRGWGPLEDDDADLPTQISGAPNNTLLRGDVRISQLVTDHFHLWERGSGNYHMGYSGFEFIRGMEADAWKTEPVTLDPRWSRYAGTKIERHFHNLAVLRDGQATPAEETYFPHRTFSTAAEWIDRNHAHTDFYLHIDSFSPHEPWDPPERLVTRFDPRGYGVEAPIPWAPQQHLDDSRLTDDQVRHIQALYAASVMYVDECLGMVWDALDRHDLWDTTLVIFTTDHGTFSGSRRRTGKRQTHLFTPISHIPLIIAHPTLAHGERRPQLVQLVDLYPTTLAALGRPIPANRHGVDLLPLFADPTAPTRDLAINGTFGESVSVTDGSWMLHLPPVDGNQPLYWYSHRHSMFQPYDLGPYECTGADEGRRPVTHTALTRPDEVWLSDLCADPYEASNLADQHPDQIDRLSHALATELERIGAPPEQLDRLGIRLTEPPDVSAPRAHGSQSAHSLYPGGA
jgi:arylsulfatase A-like enzyme